MLNIEIKSDIRIKGADLPAPVLKTIKDRLTMPNPVYIENEKRGRWNGNTEPELFYYEFVDGHDGVRVSMPRGFIYQLIGILKSYRIEYTIENHATRFKPIAFTFTGKLYPHQKKALDAILSKKYGVLCAPTGSGKTVIGLAAIAKRQQPTLIIVHTKELLQQWQARAGQYLGLSKDEIGLIGDGHKRIGDRLTIGIKNTLVNVIDEIKDLFGSVVVDEAHHCPAASFTDIVSRLSAAYMLGLSATPYRKDRLTRVIYFYLGDKIHEIETADLQESGHILKATLEVIETGWDYDYADDYSAMITELTEDEVRNEVILEAVLGQLQADSGIALVLSDRKEHCRYLCGDLVGQGVRAALLLGDMGKKERAAIVDGLRAGEYHALVATASLIGEGFDLPDISSIFLTVPIKFSGRLIQYIGRALRTAAGKTEAKIYDFLDQNGVLQASFKSRLRAYGRMGIRDRGRSMCRGIEGRSFPLRGAGNGWILITKK
ncbi:MAG: DEAD/DEAH box helicase [Nitrospirae bacterium]|nr:DEAD/DEAH box helicase [Nitrospirota bacterium]